MDEIKRLTPAQRARCNRLIRRLCANYDGGNCLPLDDGEGCSIRRKQKADSARRRRSVEH